MRSMRYIVFFTSRNILMPIDTDTVVGATITITPATITDAHAAWLIE
jgi:hypothetical protein